MTALTMPRPGQCKWTEGDSGNYTFPCTNSNEGGSYCAYHRTIVYETPEQRKARASQTKFVPYNRRLAA